MTTASPAAQSTAELPASGSSFYLGMRILPKAEREAMYAIYGFCREVDDIADSPGPSAGRIEALNAWREDIEALYRGDVRPRTALLAPHVQPFRLQKQSFHDVIDGMEMDVVETIRAPDWEKLDLYCDRVASAVGRLSARVFGLRDAEADLLAHHLGRALQLTNILRDIDEDAEIGRLYLPREALERVGIRVQDPQAVLAQPRLGDACIEVAERARMHYVESDKVMSRQPRRFVRAPRMMEAAYSSVLERTMKRGFASPRKRVSTGKLRLIGALIRYGLA